MKLSYLIQPMEGFEYKCNFQGKWTVAEYINETSIACTSPSHTKGIVSVELYLNDIPYASNDIEFEYFGSFNMDSFFY
jgi:hypothetical protein